MWSAQTFSHKFVNWKFKTLIKLHLYKPVLKETSLKSIKTIYHLIRLLMKSLFCFVSVAPNISVLRAFFLWCGFFYDAVNKKIVIILFLLNCVHMQVTIWLKLWIWHYIVNILSQIPTLWSTANRSHDWM